jgi:hypothetical protein
MVFRLALLLGLALGATATTTAVAAPQAVSAPTVTQIPVTATSHPWLAWAPLSNGYVEEEYQFTGTAGLYTYAGSGPPNWDVVIHDQQPYATRMIVRRPSDPRTFNGTVVVEWLNVTAGYDVDIEWGHMAQYFMRNGYAFVGVSAQAAGVEALKKWDSARYGNLSILDDAQSYDILSQAAAALRQADSAVLGELPIKQIIGTGVSQSAWRLVPYINAFHPTAHVYDGYLVHSRGSSVPPIQGTGVVSDNQADPVDANVDVPVLLFETEGDLLTLNYAAARQDDSAHVVTWELPGAPHVGGAAPTDAAVAAGVRARDTGTAAPPGNPVCLTNPFPAWPVLNAAWDHLRNWIAGGDPPPAAPRIQLTSTPAAAAPTPGFSNSLIARDDAGNALGGIRTPALDAPVGAFYGSSSCNPGRLGYLAGQFIPFDAATQATLYASHDVYVAKVTASAQQATADGFMLQDDANQLIDEAKASTVGSVGGS